MGNLPPPPPAGWVTVRRKNDVYINTPDPKKTTLIGGDSYIVPLAEDEGGLPQGFVPPSRRDIRILPTVADQEQGIQPIIIPAANRTAAATKQIAEGSRMNLWEKYQTLAQMEPVAQESVQQSPVQQVETKMAMDPKTSSTLLQTLSTDIPVTPSHGSRQQYAETGLAAQQVMQQLPITSQEQAPQATTAADPLAFLRGGGQKPSVAVLFDLGVGGMCEAYYHAATCRDHCVTLLFDSTSGHTQYIPPDVSLQMPHIGIKIPSHGIDAVALSARSWHNVIGSLEISTFIILDQPAASEPQKQQAVQSHDVDVLGAAPQ